MMIGLVRQPVRKATLFMLAGVLCVMGYGNACAAQAETQSLAGVWRLALDRSDVGEKERWFARELRDGDIRLPGSMQEQGFGDAPTSATEWTGNIGVRSVDWIHDPKFAPYAETNGFKMPFILTPDRHYVGAAWYQREVEIPTTWTDRRIVLHLERPHWETALWVDEKKVGTCEALGTAHEYDLTELLTLGRHRLTLRIDNRMRIPVGLDAHSISDQTQGNWNGVVGRIALTAGGKVWIDDVQVYPDGPNRKARVVVTVGNRSGAQDSGALKAVAESFNTSQTKRAVGPNTSVSWNKDGGHAEFEIDLGKDALLWDEFSPALYRLTVEFQADGVSDSREVTFGLRDLKVKGTQFALNGRAIYLRGTLECCIFPRTGYPPTDVDSWKRVLTVARAHGLNHLRFHSWCPPEAAFQAGDEMGFYFQAEGSCWSSSFGEGTPLDRWAYEESERMLRAYGNHPSFMFMALSNEASSEKDSLDFLSKWVTSLRKTDPRRMYAAASGFPAVPEDDYHVPVGTRGSPEKTKRGETTRDHRDFIRKEGMPSVFHEIGQYCAYPNFDEIRKYTGWLKARNFEILRDFLKAHGMLRQAHDFLMASGKLQALCYKEEIEADLRTPGMAGFALLDLHDFPGQGTALVGVLDAFWESKGYISPKEYRRFCGGTVPLARLEKRCFTNDETFRARIEVAHYGPTDLEGSEPTWRVRDASGNIVREGKLVPSDIPTGALTALGEVSLPLAEYEQAKKLNLEVSLAGTQIGNDWDFWVYPRCIETAAPKSVHVAHALDEDTVTTLTEGGTVLLIPRLSRIVGDTLGSFTPIFWNRVTFVSQRNHTLGILCDPKHPAFQEFPTEFHSNWQWQDLAKHSRPVILDHMPQELVPILQVIDDPFMSRRLGLAFEARVGKGKLLFCAVDLERDLEQRPAASQLRYSLLSYMAGSKFNPAVTLTPEQVKSLLSEHPAMDELGARVVRADSETTGHAAANAIDSSPTSIWHTPWGEGAPQFPHELMIAFESPLTLTGCRLLPRQDVANGQIKGYEIYVSTDSQNWGAPAASGELSPGAAWKTIRFKQKAAGKYLRLVAKSGFKNAPFVALAELDVIGQTDE